MKINFKNYIVEVDEVEGLTKEQIKDRALKAMRVLDNNLKDSDCKDVPPMLPPERNTEITYSEKIPKASHVITTLSNLNSAIQDYLKGDQSKIKVIEDKASDFIDSIKNDINNADQLKSNYTKDILEQLISEYVDAADLLSKVKLDDYAKTINESISKLEDKLNLYTWDKPKFTNKMKHTASEKYRKMKKSMPWSKRSLDSSISTKWEPVFQVSETKLNEHYYEAKKGIHTKMFEVAIEKVIEDANADATRIMNKNDTYFDIYPTKILEKIVNYYEKALKYSIDLGYNDEAARLSKLIDVIKSGWAIDNL